MTNKINTLARLSALLIGTGMTSCGFPGTDQPKLVYRSVPQTKFDRPISKPSPQFVVTIEEALLAVPLRKTGWEIYADRTNYYLLPAAGGPKINTSSAIRQYGIPISGVTRHDIDRINHARPRP